MKNGDDGSCLLQIVEETLPTLLELKKEGSIRNIGFSGLPLAIYKKILDRCRCQALSLLIRRG